MNKRFARLNSGVLEWYEQPANMIGDCSVHAAENGYKEVEYRTGSNGTFEENDKIVVETPECQRLWVEVLNPYLVGYSEQQVQNTNADLLQGLHKARRYCRGYLCETKYFADAEHNNVAVKRTCELVFHENVLRGEKTVITWYKEDGTEAFSKESVVEYSAKDAASRLREIRQIRIDYLQYPEPQYMTPQVIEYITKLFEHYKNVVVDYILSGGTAFAESIKNETQQPYLSILNAILPDGKTVKESILYQIEGEY